MNIINYFKFMIITQLFGKLIDFGTILFAKSPKTNNHHILFLNFYKHFNFINDEAI